MPCVLTHGADLTPLGLICVIAIGPPTDETPSRNKQNQEIKDIQKPVMVQLREDSNSLTACVAYIDITDVCKTGELELMSRCNLGR